jgi:hypothetical protein
VFFEGFHLATAVLTALLCCALWLGATAVGLGLFYGLVHSAAESEDI